jgi:hypothetical protein
LIVRVDVVIAVILVIAFFSAVSTTATVTAIDTTSSDDACGVSGEKNLDSRRPGAVVRRRSP